MDGRVRWAQSVEAPWRTNSALVKATKDMVMAKMPTQMPLWEDSAAVLARTPKAEATVDCGAGKVAAAAATGGWMVEDIIEKVLCAFTAVAHVAAKKP